MSTLPGPGEGPPAPSSTDGQIGRSPDLAGSGTPGGEPAAAPAQTGPLGKLKGLFGSPDLAVEPASVPVPESPPDLESIAEAPTIDTRITPLPNEAPATPTPEPGDVGSSAIEGVSPPDLQASSTEAFTRLAADPGAQPSQAPTEEQTNERGRQAEPWEERALLERVRHTLGDIPAQVDISGPDATKFLQTYLQLASRDRLDSSLKGLTPLQQANVTTVSSNLANFLAGKPIDETLRGEIETLVSGLREKDLIGNESASQTTGQEGPTPAPEATSTITAEPPPVFPSTGPTPSASPQNPAPEARVPQSVEPPAPPPSPLPSAGNSTNT